MSAEVHLSLVARNATSGVIKRGWDELNSSFSAAARACPLRKYIFHPDEWKQMDGGEGEEEGEKKNYAFAREREYNLIFSLLRRTLVGLEELIHAPSPPLVTLARKKQRRVSGLRERADPSAESGQRFPAEKTPRLRECR